MFPPTLAAYVPLLRETDDLHRLRLIAHEFGLRWRTPRSGKGCR